MLLCSKAEADLQRASDAAALEENTGSEGEHDDISPAHIDQVIGSVMAAEERLAEVAATAAQSVSGATAKIELLALVKKTMPFDADIAAGLIQSIAEDYQRGFS